MLKFILPNPSALIVSNELLPSFVNCNRAQTHLKLGELDDIGGCRLILETNNQVRQAAEILKSQIPLKKGSGEKDYILNPQKSGYRSRHLLFQT